MTRRGFLTALLALSAPAMVAAAPASPAPRSRLVAIDWSPVGVGRGIAKQAGEHAHGFGSRGHLLDARCERDVEAPDAVDALGSDRSEARSVERGDALRQDAQQRPDGEEIGVDGFRHVGLSGSRVTR